MKKTQVIELFANIKKTRISFISILMFVFLGMGIFLGLGFVGEGLADALNRYFDYGNMHDIEVYYPYGIDDKQVEQIKNIAGIDEVEAFYYGYEFFDYNGEKIQAKIISIRDDIDYLFDIEGRLPTSNNEIVIDKGTSEKNNLQIGDVITFYGNDSQSSYLLSLLKNKKESDLQDALLAYEDTETSFLNNDTFTVVGIAINDEYISKSVSSYGQSSVSNMQVNAIFYVTEDSFNHDVIDEYNTLLIRSDSLRNLDTFSDEYINKADEFVKKIQAYLDSLNDDSYNDAYNGYHDLLKYCQNELDEAKLKIEDAKVEIANNEKKLNEAKTKLAEAKKTIEENELKLQNAKEELLAYDQLLTNKINEINQIKNAVKDFRSAFTDNIEDIDENNVENKLKALIALIDNSSIKNEISDSIKVNTIDEMYAFLVDLANDDIAYLKETENPQASIYEENINNIVLSEETKDKKCILIIDELVDISKQIDDKTGVDILYHNFLTKFDLLIEEKFNEIDALIKTYKDQLDDAWCTYNYNEQLLNDAKTEYQKSVNEYENGVKKLKQAKLDLQDGIEKYEQGLLDFEELKSKEELLVKTDTIVLTRQSNGAVMYVSMLQEIMSKVKYSLGGLFLLISLLVCYSVITRIVHDQTIQIGTKKALGLLKKEITLSYLAYSGLTVIIGGLLGLALCVFVIEPVLAPSVTGTFTFETNPHYFVLKDFLILFFGELFLIEAITYAGCNSVLNRSAIKLLQGDVVVNGKTRIYEKLPMWNRLSLLTKTIINNCFNDSRRIIATIVGVAGCTALIVCAITMRNNVLKSFNAQFNDYFKFDSFVYFDSSVEGAQENIKSVLDDLQVKNTPIYRQFGYVGKNDEFEDIFAYIMVYDDKDSNFNELVYFDSYHENNSFEIGETWIADSICDYYGLNIGDVLTFTGIKGDESDISIDGYFHFYYYNSMLFMSDDTYEQQFNKAYEPNIYMIDTSTVDIDELKTALKQVAGYNSVFDFENYVGADAAVFTSIADVIVYLYSGVSLLMAIFVLLNLLITFVEEKKRELIVLMINGFSLKQARRYIYSDTILLTIIGIGFGIVVGNFAGNMCINAFEGKYLYLLHELDLSACAIGSAFTIVLTTVMTLIALRRIKYFKLTDINK